MGVYVKDNAGNIKKLAGYITQKQNARWFLCTRSLEDGIEYYDVPQSAEEYYKTIDAYTIYSFGFAETNTTNYPKLRYGTTILDIKDVTNARNRIEIGQLNGVYSMYTQDLVADPKMYFVGTSHPDTEEVENDGVTIIKNNEGKLQAVGLESQDNSINLTAKQIYLACTIEKEVQDG